MAPIADQMRSQGLITDEDYSEIMAGKTRQAQVREIYRTLNSLQMKSDFFTILQQEQPSLVKELSESE